MEQIQSEIQPKFRTINESKIQLKTLSKNGNGRMVQEPKNVSARKEDDSSEESATFIEQFLSLVESDPDAALTLLIEKYRQEIFDLTIRISGSRSEAEDLTQETFIKAYEHLGKFRGESHPRTWLYRIAINRSISFTRRLKRWRMQRGGDEELFPEIPDTSTVSIEKQVEWDNLADHAHRALQSLPDRQKVAVILRAVQGFSYEDISQTMNISVGGAKANVFQGLKKLRSMLGVEDGHE